MRIPDDLADETVRLTERGTSTESGEKSLAVPFALSELESVLGQIGPGPSEPPPPQS